VHRTKTGVHRPLFAAKATRKLACTKYEPWLHTLNSFAGGGCAMAELSFVGSRNIALKQFAPMQKKQHQELESGEFRESRRL